MAKIEGFKVKNYGVLKDVGFGRFWNTQDMQPLNPLNMVIGKNGVGKSTLFDAFGFLADCLKVGVEEACDLRSRGGFERLKSQGQKGPVEFEVYYKQDHNSRPLTYELAIDSDKSGRPLVVKERLRQRRKGQKFGRPFSFLMLDHGTGLAWKGEDKFFDNEDDELNQNALRTLWNKFRVQSKEESRETEFIELDDPRKLGIATLGSLKQHPRISAFRKFIESWYLSYFTPDAARSLPLAGPQKRLSLHGDNLANVVQFMEREHPKEFDSILGKIISKTFWGQASFPSALKQVQYVKSKKISTTYDMKNSEVSIHMDLGANGAVPGVSGEACLTRLILYGIIFFGFGGTLDAE
jgi:predicted ATPase